VIRLLATLLLASAVLTACTTDDIQAGLDAAAAVTTDPKQREKLERTSARIAAAAPMSDSRKKEIGGAIAIKSFAEQGPLVPNRELQRYVTLVGKLVAKASATPDASFYFGVVDSTDLSSWSAPGGYVFITTGLLRTLQDESELAAVLAHEISHLASDDLVLAIQRQEQRAVGGQRNALDSALPAEVGGIQWAANTGYGVLFTSGLDLSVEVRADRDAMDYLASTGYDPQALIRVTDRLSRLGVEATGTWVSALHPRAIERRLDLQRHYDSNGYAELTGARVENRFAESMLLLTP
jgi:predicted Zn-dependent protease